VGEFAVSVLSSVVASGVLTAVLIWLSKDWMSARIRTSIQHEYDRRLDTLRAQLSAQHESHLLQLQATITREATRLAAAHSSGTDGQKAPIERTLHAVERLWDGVLRLRTTLPPVLGFVDTLTVDEYKRMKTHPTFLALSGAWSVERISELIDTDVEQVRPYIGEYAWALFYSYQAVMLRIVALLHTGRHDVDKLEWHKDSGTRQLIQAVFSAAELVEFDGTRTGRIAWLQRRFEAHLLAAARTLISGQEFAADDASEQARVIQEKAAQLTAGQRPDKLLHSTSGTGALR